MAVQVYPLAVSLRLEKARAVIRGALEAARRAGLQPLTVVVLDGGGNLIAAEREDGCGPLRFPVACGKAYAALGTGTSSGTVGARNQQRPAFLAATAAAADGRFVPVAGGVLVLNDAEEVVGAVGVSGDISDQDEAAAVAGIEAAGLKAGLDPTAVPVS
jgi:glc operon protein GlcG